MQKQNEVSTYIIPFQLEDRRKGCQKKEGKTNNNLIFLLYSAHFETLDIKVLICLFIFINFRNSKKNSMLMKHKKCSCRPNTRWIEWNIVVRIMLLCSLSQLIIPNPLICRTKQRLRLLENYAKAFASKQGHYLIFIRKGKHPRVRQKRYFSQIVNSYIRTFCETFTLELSDYFTNS